MHIIEAKVTEWQKIIEVNRNYGAEACPRQTPEKRPACEKVFKIIVDRRNNEKEWLEAIVFSFTLNRDSRMRITEDVLEMNQFNQSMVITNKIWDRARLEYHR